MAELLPHDLNRRRRSITLSFTTEGVSISENGVHLFDLVLDDHERAAAASTWSPPTAEQLALVVDTRTPGVRVLAGDFDALTAIEVVRGEALAVTAARGLLEIHDGAWKCSSRGDPLMSSKRGISIARALREGFRVSDFARGILGMRKDEWDGRALHRDFTFVARQLERWIELYQNGPAPTTTRQVKARCGRVVVVPATYKWSDADEHAAASGMQFDRERWVANAT